MTILEAYARALAQPAPANDERLSLHLIDTVGAWLAGAASAEPYTDWTPQKGLWHITTVKVDPSHIDDYLVGLKKTWVPGEEIAKKHGATFLVDKSGPTLVGVSNILYFDPSLDITDEVATELNKDKPAASATPAASTAAPAPAAGDSPKITVPGIK